MAKKNDERCGKCGAEIDPARRVDFTLKDDTRHAGLAEIRGRQPPR
jgi:hypothetical protein